MRFEAHGFFSLNTTKLKRSKPVSLNPEFPLGFETMVDVLFEAVFT